MKDLWCRVSSKIADTGSLVIDCTGQIFGGKFCFGKSSFLKAPILAIETVKGTGMIEDGQIITAIFWPITHSVCGMTSACPGRAYPVCHTVGGKGIIIKVEISFMGSSTFQSPLVIPPYPTIPQITFSYLAIPHTAPTLQPIRVFWGTKRKPKSLPTLLLYFSNMKPSFIEMGTNTSCAIS